jgi:ABC-type glycerol-3-phosphate transport system permease component
MKILRLPLIYFLLVAGSVVFVWPFLWMAATSAKLDRELFSESLTVLAGTAYSPPAIALPG